MSEQEFIPPPISPNARSRKPAPLAPGWGALAVPLAVLAAALFLPIWFWFFWRIEPAPGEIAVLIRKTGKDLPSGQILALEKGQKGIQLDVLAEGRWFKNPYSWDWEIRKITDIPAGKLGVLTRLYGKELPGGQILAPEGYKGIVPKVLGPGKHRINPYAYGVQQFDAITIRPGFGGVMTSLVSALDGCTGEDEAARRAGEFLRPLRAALDGLAVAA